MIHGELDYRVPATQALQYYNTLKAKDVPARLVYFPDENHWILKPQNSRLWYREFFAWLARYAPPGRPKARTAPPGGSAAAKAASVGGSHSRRRVAPRREQRRNVQAVESAPRARPSTRAVRDVFFLDVVAEVRPRRRRCRESPPHLARYAAVFERSGRQFDDELARSRVVAGGAEVAAVHPPHFHRIAPRSGVNRVPIGSILVFCSLLVTLALLQPAHAADAAKTLRVAFSIAETSFDPAFASDAASDDIIATCSTRCSTTITWRGR